MMAGSLSIIATTAELVALGLPIAQQIADGVVAEMKLSGSSAPPTAAELAALDAALDAAHAALQAAQPAAGVPAAGALPPISASVVMTTSPAKIG